MFSNDPEQIIKIYDRVEEISLNRDGELVTKNSLEAMGFNFKAPNVEEVPGPTAFRKIFGAPVFNETYEKGEQPGASLKDLEAYRGFSIPHQRISTTTDRIYFSHREIFQTGDLVNIFLLFKGETLCYHEVYAVKIDTYQSHYSPGEGVITVLEAPGKAVYSILQALQVYQLPGIELITRIPLIP